MSTHDSSKRSTLSLNPDAKKGTTAARKAARQRTGPRARRLEQAAYEQGQDKISARTLARTGVSPEKLKTDKNLAYRLSKHGMTEQRLAKQAAAKEAHRPQRQPADVPTSAWNPQRKSDDEGALRRREARGVSNQRRMLSESRPTTPRLDPRPGRPAPQGINYQAESPELVATAFATCPQGLEEALSKELQHLGFKEISAGRSGVYFQCDWLGMMKANLYSRLATRILLQVAQAEVQHEEDIYALALRTPWEHFFGPEHTLRVDTSAIRSPMQSLHFCNLKAKDGIVDRIREKEGARPSIDTVRPDAKVHLFLYRNQATLYLDTSGESLFKRGWRLDKGSAPLRENLAAGMLALSGWEPGQALLDPFCGSGTILIEAAWWAQNVPPGLHRPFQFMRLRNHNRPLWHELRDAAFSQIKPSLDTPLYGSDISPEAIEAVRANMERANLNPNTIKLQVANALTIEAPCPSGVIITNPPYGERLESGQDDIWLPFSGRLKQQFDGWRVNIISSDLELPKKLRLKAQRRIPLYNGNLETRMFVFEMVRESFRDQ